MKYAGNEHLLLFGGVECKAKFSVATRSVQTDSERTARCGRMNPPEIHEEILGDAV